MCMHIRLACSQQHQALKIDSIISTFTVSPAEDVQTLVWDSSNTFFWKLKAI